MKEKIEVGIKLVGITYGLVFLLGGIVSFRYSLNIGFYPVGVGIGDSLFFVSSALMFLVVYGVYLLLITPLSLFVLKLFRPIINWIANKVSNRYGSKRELQKLPSFMPWLTVPLSVMLFIFVFGKDNQLFQAMLITAEIIMLGMFILYLSEGESQEIIRAKYDADTENNKKAFLKYGVLVAIILFPLIESGSLKYLSQITMAQMGISLLKANVSINKEVAQMLGKQPNEKGRYLFDDAVVLWTGIGELTLIEKAGVRYRLPSKDIIIDYPTTQ